MKKFLSIMLSAVMIFGMLPAYAAPLDGQVTEETVELFADKEAVTTDSPSDEGIAVQSDEDNGIATHALSNAVYVSFSLESSSTNMYYETNAVMGDNNNPGTADKPVRSLKKAYELVADGGTIYILSNVATWANYPTSEYSSDIGYEITTSKNVTIQGVTYNGGKNTPTQRVLYCANASQNPPVLHLYGSANVTLKNITLAGTYKFDKTNKVRYAIIEKGTSLTLGEGVKFVDPITLAFNNYGTINAATTIDINETAMIYGDTDSYVRRAAGFTGTMFNVTAGTLGIGNTILDGGASYSSYDTNRQWPTGVKSGWESAPMINVSGTGSFTASKNTIQNVAGQNMDGVIVKSTSTEKITITDTTIENCVTTKYGGGLINLTAGSLAITNSTIQKNSALNINNTQGAGLISAYGGTTTIKGSTLKDNYGQYFCGAIWVKAATVDVDDTNIINNHSDTQPYGAIVAQGTAGTKVNLGGTTTIKDNTCAKSGRAKSNFQIDNASYITVKEGFTGEVGISQPTALNAVFTQTDGTYTYSSGGKFTNDVYDNYVPTQKGTKLQWTEVHDVYVSSKGSDSNEGTPDRPLASLTAAWNLVTDKGTIYVMDDLTNINNAGNPNASIGGGNKNVTIKGIAYDNTKTDPNTPIARTLSYYSAGSGTQGIVKFAGGGSATFEYITFNGNSNSTCLWVGDADSSVTLGTGTSLMNPGKGWTATGNTYINNLGTVYIGATQNLASDGQIEGSGTVKRAAGFNGIMFKNSGAITTKGITFDGGAVYSGYDETHGYPTGVTSGNAEKLFDATGTLTLDNGTTIRNFASESETAVIKANNGLNINNGAIIELCYDSHKWGDIIEVYGTLNMTGGEIRKNYGTSYIVWMQRENSSIVNLSAGKLTDNCSSCGAIAVTSSNSDGSIGTTINISGNPEIKNNVNTSGKISNLYFDKGRTLNLTDAFNGNIGISCGDDNDICDEGKIFGTTASGVTYTAGFTNDKHSEYVAIQDGTQLKWEDNEQTDPQNIYVSSTGNNDNPGTPNKPLSSLAGGWDKVADGGTIYVMDDLTNINNATYATSANFGTGNKRVTIKGIAYDSSKTDPNVPQARTLSYYTSGSGTQGIVKFSGGGNVTFEYITFNGNSNATCLYVGDANSTVTLGTGTSMINPGKGNFSTGKTYIHNLGTVYIGTTQTLASEGQIEGGGLIKRADGFDLQLFSVTGGTVTIKDTTIDGGAVYSKFDDKGYPTELQSGASNKEMVAVNNEGTKLILENGAILQNNAPTYSWGNAVFVNNKATLEMNAGAVIEKIYDNNIKQGVVYLENGATFNMNGGEIRYNNLQGINYHGVVEVKSGTTFSMTGGNIHNNNAAGVYTTTNSKINVSGSATVTDNAAADGSKANMVLFDASVLTLSGEFTGNIGINCADGKDICELSKTFGTTASGVTYTDGFTNDKYSDYVAFQNGTNLIWVEMVARTQCDGGEWKYFQTLQEAINAATGTNNIVEILKNIEVTQKLTGTTSYTLRSGNNETYTIKRGGNYKSEIYAPNGGANVTLENIIFDGGAVYSTYDENGVPTAALSGQSSQPIISISATSANPCKLVLGNGAIIKNNANTGGYGSAIYVAYTTLEMQEGSVIEKCLETPKRGIIYQNTGATFNMKGGEIRYNNTAINVLNMQNNATVTATFTGGKIHHNIGYGVWTNANNTVNVSGTAEITDNTLGNLYVTKLINLTGEFNGNIGITCASNTKFCSTGQAFATAADGVTYTKGFTNDKKPDYYAFQNETDIIWLGDEVARTQCDGGKWQYFNQLNDAFNAATETNNVVELLADINVEQAHSTAKNFTFRSSTREKDNGKIFTLKRNISKVNLFTFSGTVVLENIIFDGNKAEYPYSTSVNGESALIKTSKSLTLGKGTTLKDNAVYTSAYTSNKAGAVFVQGILTMEDGAVIEGCECNDYASAIMIYAGISNKLIMKGGKIQNNILHNTNDIANLGGCVYASDNAIIEMSGGIITENKIADKNAENITAGPTIRNGSKLIISGGAIIADNENMNGSESNFCMPYGNPTLPSITVKSDFSGKLSITKAGMSSKQDMMSKGKQFATAEAGYQLSGTFINDEDLNLTASLDGTTLKWGAAVAEMLDGGAATGQKFETLTEAIAAYKKDNTQIIRIISDISETENVLCDKDVYLDLNGFTIHIQTTGNGKIYGMDTATVNYTDDKCGAIIGVVGDQVQMFTETDVNRLGPKAMHFVKVKTDNGDNTETVTFPRFNLQFYRYVGFIGESTANMNAVWALQGNSNVMNVLTQYGGGTSDVVNYENNANTEATGTTKPFFYQTQMFDIRNFDNLAEFTTAKNLVGGLMFGEGNEYTIYPVTRTYIQTLYLAYQKADEETKQKIDEFMTTKVSSADLTAMWNRMKTENGQ